MSAVPHTVTARARRAGSSVAARAHHGACPRLMRASGIVTFALALTAGAGCKGTTAAAGGGPSGITNAVAEDRSRCDTTGKRVVKLDINDDKQPDVWKLYKSKKEENTTIEVMVCKERDLNFDGRKDIWYYYDDDGSLKLEEMDLDFDGRVDLVTVRRGGKVQRQEMDTNQDGSPDVWKHFEEEVLVRVERDSNRDGRTDYWEYYEGGQLDRIGYDRSGDGRVDHWDRAPSAAAEEASREPQREN